MSLVIKLSSEVCHVLCPHNLICSCLLFSSYNTAMIGPTSLGRRKVRRLSAPDSQDRQWSAGRATVLYPHCMVYRASHVAHIDKLSRLPHEELTRWMHSRNEQGRVPPNSPSFAFLCRYRCQDQAAAAALASGPNFPRQELPCVGIMSWYASIMRLSRAGRSSRRGWMRFATSSLTRRRPRGFRRPRSVLSSR